MQERARTTEGKLGCLSGRVPLGLVWLHRVLRAAVLRPANGLDGVDTAAAAPSDISFVALDFTTRQ